MTAIIEALKEAIKERLEIPAFVLPQAADTDSAHIALSFIDCAPNGNNDTLLLSAEFVTGGTHKKWLSTAAKAKRSLRLVEDSCMPLTCADGTNLRAYWKRNGNPGWVYNNESGDGMPAKYRAPYTVTIDFPEKYLLED